MYLNYFITTLDLESCISCQILSIDIHFLPDRPVGREQKVKHSRMNLFLQASVRSTPETATMIGPVETP